MFGILAMNMGDEDAVAVLDFIVKTIVKVFDPPFRLAQARGGIVIFVDNPLNKNRGATTAACGDLSSRGAFCLALGLCFGAAGQTLRRTSRHPDLLRLPVDLGVVLAKPGKTEGPGSIAQRGACERTRR